MLHMQIRAGEAALEARTAFPAVRPDGMSETEFRAFYDATYRPLWGYLARTLGSGSLADDLTQEAYLRLLRAEFRPESEAHRKNYLFRIATNLTRDHFRARRPMSELPDLPVPAEMDRQVDLPRDVGRVFGELKPRERQLLWLGHVEGFSHKEIARMLGLRSGSIRLLLFRARRKLAGLLRERGLAPEAST